MAAFLARRIAQGLAVVLLVATIVFFLIHAAPGDPFSASMENPAITESVRAMWRHEYGLDRPLGEQYLRYVASVAHGDLGFSFSLQRPVAEALGRLDQKRSQNRDIPPPQHVSEARYIRWLTRRHDESG